ncbi:hypothetical protein HANVADRAFT_51107 [Hanseniaspora valbyensis NRRL Y-1626]|uniref:Zn(2)-C6 fungal-type domain-containing protein n=1 Tax=Hanseniaspora valbyensis NRRL Y-1626 TaxID=766949 RepID=A0A1B7TKD2_9ASCO|nr:hypothetical protein HANVADRAFT_51107 [Hanseniaspora valbyensis NRRL Y-1626]
MQPQQTQLANSPQYLQPQSQQLQPNTSPQYLQPQLQPNTSPQYLQPQSQQSQAANSPQQYLQPQQIQHTSSTQLSQSQQIQLANSPPQIQHVTSPQPIQPASLPPSSANYKVFKNNNSNPKIPKNNKISSTLDKNNVSKLKRVKVSYTCTECRVRRTKCDRKTPCSSCFAKNLSCKYDTEKQIKPKKPNKDSLILRLSKQLQFYKDLACKHTPKRELTLFANDLEEIDYALGVRTLKKGANIDLNSNNNINSGNTSTTPLPSNSEPDVYLSMQKKCAPLDVNIFSDAYLFKTDYYINTFLLKPKLNFQAGKTKDKNVTSNSIKEEEAVTIVANTQRQSSENENEKDGFFQMRQSDSENNAWLSKNSSDIKLNEFIQSNSRDKDFKMCSFQKKQTRLFIKRIKESANRDRWKSSSSVYSRMFDNFQFEGITNNTVEDCVDPEKGMSPLLTKIIETVNKALPDYKTVTILKKFYYTDIFPDLPFLCIQEFENFLKECLFEDEKTGKAYIKLENERIKEKICFVAILLLIQGSSIFLIRMNKDSEVSKKMSYFPVFDAEISLPIKLIMSTNPLIEPSKIELYALLNVWVNYFFIPNPMYSPDIASAIPTDFMAKFVSNLASNMGIRPLNGEVDTLGIDEEDSENIESRTNLRKQLAIFTSGIVCIEEVLKGQAFNFKIVSKEKEAVEEYLKTIHMKEKDIYQTFVYNLSLTKVFILNLVKECNSIIASGENNVNVTLLEKKLEYCQSVIQPKLDVKYFRSQDANDYLTITSETKINKNVCINKLVFDINCFQKFSLLKIYNILVVISEEAYYAEQKEIAEPIFIKYVKLSLDLSIESILLLNDYITGKYGAYVDKAESITVGLAVTNLFSKVMTTFLQLISKFYVCKIYLQIKLVNENSTDAKLINDNISVGIIIDKLSELLFLTLDLYSLKYRYYYFNSFKICLFFSYYKKIHENGTIFNHIFQSSHHYEPNGKIPDEIKEHFLIKRLTAGNSFMDSFEYILNLLNEDKVTDFLKNQGKNKNIKKKHKRKNIVDDPSLFEENSDNSDNIDFDFSGFFETLSKQNNGFFDIDILFQ